MNSKKRFVKIVNAVAFISAIAGLLAFVFLAWQWHYYFPAQTQPSHGVPNGSMSGVGIKGIIGGIIFWILLINMNFVLSLAILVSMAAAAVAIISTSSALISAGVRQSKPAWISLFIFLNACLLTFIVLDHDNLSYWLYFAPLLWLSCVSFGLSVGILITDSLFAKKLRGYFAATEEKIDRSVFLLSAGGFLLGIISFIVFSITNLVWK